MEDDYLKGLFMDRTEALYNAYFCQIIVDHEDFEGEMVSDCHNIAHEVFENFDDAMDFLKKQSENPEANYMELIVANGRSNKHFSFFRWGHPYAEVGCLFEDIDDFIEKEREAYIKRTNEPDRFDLEMQYIDLLEGITPEMFAAGKTVKEVKAAIPDCDQRVRDLLYMLSHRMFDNDFADDFDIHYIEGIKFFWDGIVDGATHKDYWQTAWEEGGADILMDVFQNKYIEDMTLTSENIMFISRHTQLAFYFYFYGVYFHGLAYYVA